MNISQKLLPPGGSFFFMPKRNKNQIVSPYIKYR